MFLDVTESSVKDYVTVTRGFKNPAMKGLIIEAIRRVASSGLSRNALARYCLDNIDNIQLTEKNVQKLISLAFSPNSTRAKLDRADGSKTYEATVYEIPAESPFGAILKDAPRGSDGKTFTVENGKITVRMPDRPSFIACILVKLEKEQVTASTVEGALFGFMYQFFDNDKK
jgi:hypothetical protein